MGRQSANAKDLTGLRIGFLTVVRYSGAVSKWGTRLWEAVCDCGNVKLWSTSRLVHYKKKGVEASCGCQQHITVARKISTHGMRKHPAYKVWTSMKDRCMNETHYAWHNYGGRGITVCESWQNSFEAFWSDVGAGYARGLSLDRIDNDKGYAPDNVRWATRTEQANNRRGVRHRIGNLTVKEFATKHGLTVSTITRRINRGVPENLLGAPTRTIPKKFFTADK